MKRFLAIILAFALMFCCGCDNNANNNTEVSGELQVYFIDVGQADCALIIQEGKSMLVDGGNVADGLDVVRFIKSKNIETLDVVVATHAHEDHIGGLATIIDNFTVNKIYCPVNDYNSTCFDEFIDAANRQCGITLCAKGDNWDIGDAKINVVWPVNADIEETNNTSIVFTLKYGKITYLFTGDAEHDAETSIVHSGTDIKADVLKVGHHGSNTSSSYLFLRTVLPQIAVISCGKDNSYRHPHDEVLDRYLQAEATVLRTDELKTICISTDGEKLTAKYGETVQDITVETATPGLQPTGYIGNRNSKKFHLSSCKSLPKEENRVIFESREQAVNDGYAPCGSCQP